MRSIEGFFVYFGLAPLRDSVVGLPQRTRGAELDRRAALMFALGLAHGAWGLIEPWWLFDFSSAPAAYWAILAFWAAPAILPLGIVAYWGFADCGGDWRSGVAAQLILSPSSGRSILAFYARRCLKPYFYFLVAQLAATWLSIDYLARSGLDFGLSLRAMIDLACDTLLREFFLGAAYGFAVAMAALALAPRVRSPFYGACAAGLALWLAVPAGQITPSGGRGPLGSIWESVFFFSLVDTTRSAARYFAWTGIFGLAALAIGLYFEKMALNAIGRGAE